jgi:ABC-type taurine transport system substrate-binding protein/outer membrane protein OmpA-like peptidoglycan-associated protein
MRRKFALVVFGLASSLTFAAPNYIDLKPLTEVVKATAGNVKNGTQNLPMITWGGDIATIYANGNQLNTTDNSIFGKKGLSYRLSREDVFANQLENYIEGDTAILRGTMDMINSASDLLADNPDLNPVVFYQMTYSNGGDALVVKPGINNASDLKGKTIAHQAYGPHVNYLIRVLNDSGLSINDVKVKWLPDLTGTDNTPMEALYEQDIDAAFVIIPDALALTSGGSVGTGAEDSVKGAKILLSTKTANKVIADVYAVRADYYKKNKDEIERLTQGLLEAAEAVKKIVSDRKKDPKTYNALMRSSAKFLLDSPDAISDTEGLYADAEYVYLSGNTQFFTNPNHPRSFEKLNSETGAGLKALGLIKNPLSTKKADLNYKRLSQGLTMKSNINKPKFNKDQLSSLVSRKQQQGSLADGELFSFDVFFSANQTNFPIDLYQKEFDKVIELASTYGGAVITVEGHSDPMGYLRAKKANKPPVVLSRIKQSAKNLSVNRSQSVRDAIMTYASSQSISLDESQFEPIGHGITSPSTGICGNDPCAPVTEQEWRSNMRVVFRIIQIEAESGVFMPL